MKTLILHRRYDDDSQRLWQAAVTAGWNVVRADYNAPVISADDEIAIYGGFVWGARVAELIGVRLDWIPDEWLLMNRHVLHRWVRLAKGSDLSSEEWPLFVKSAKHKAIDSRVYWSRSELPPGIEDDELFIVEEPVQFIQEYRGFVLDGEVLTMSKYAEHGCLEMHGDATTARKYLASIVPQLNKLPRSAVVDVGRLADDRWAVVEANPSWCSGVYGCDAVRVLDAVRVACSARTSSVGRPLIGD